MVDGAVAGKVRRGQSVTLAVEAGKHEVYLKVDWAKSEVFELSLASGDHARIVCGGRSPFAALFYLFTQPSLYIRAEIEGERFVDFVDAGGGTAETG